MDKYRITARTNQYIANRSILFRGNTEIVMYSGMSLKDARERLLCMFNSMFDASVPNWGMAVIRTQKRCDGAASTFKDGTRSFSFDSRTFTIEKEQ